MARRCSTRALAWGARPRRRNVSELVGPESVCSVDGCEEPAVRTPRAAIAEQVVDGEPETGQLVPLCARHAEQADAPEAGDPAGGVVDPTGRSGAA